MVLFLLGLVLSCPVVNGDELWDWDWAGLRFGAAKQQRDGGF